MHASETSRRAARYRQAAILLLAGFCFGKAQVSSLRELVSLIYGEEVVLWLVSSVALVGAAFGYSLGSWISKRALAQILLVCALFHMVNPAWIRLTFAGLSSLHGQTGPEHLVAAALAAGLASVPFCALLPAMVAGQTAIERVGALRVAYGCELVGFALGSAMGHWLGASPTWSFGLHTLAWTLLLVALLGWTWRQTSAWLMLAGLAIATHTTLNTHTANLVYATKHRLPGARVLWSVDTTYQRVEVIEAPGRGKMLYLDGLRNLDARSLKTLNHYLARVPGQRIQPAQTLLLGNGTLSMVEELAGLSGQLTSVEIDPGVVDAGARFFTPTAPLQRLTNWRLIYADGKAYLAGTDHRFDLIIADIPSPLSLGEAYLHTREFYQLCADHMTPDGVLAVQLSGTLGSVQRTPARILAGLREVFANIVVIESEQAERSFAYASKSRIFDTHAITALASPGETKLSVLAGKRLMKRLDTARPLTLDDLDLVLRRGLERLGSRHGLD